MNVNAGRAQAPQPRVTQPAKQKLPAWMRAVTQLTRRQLDANAFPIDPNNGNPEVAKAPKTVQDFCALQQDALGDNDGKAALIKLPGRSGAWAVRWHSENHKLDRLFVFDRAGKPIAKGWTDTGHAYKWVPAKGPFTVDDMPEVQK
jgi:hypothetical protein